MVHRIHGQWTDLLSGGEWFGADADQEGFSWTRKALQVCEVSCCSVSCNTYNLKLSSNRALWLAYIYSLGIHYMFSNLCWNFILYMCYITDLMDGESLTPMTLLCCLGLSLSSSGLLSVCGHMCHQQWCQHIYNLVTNFMNAFLFFYIRIFGISGWFYLDCSGNSSMKG